jgi:GTP-binding protein HflX
MAEVHRVLAEIGASDIAQVLVYNKLDQLDDTQHPRVLVDSLELDGGLRVPRVFVSAQGGEGMAELRALLAQAVAGSLDAGLNADLPAPSSDDAPATPAPDTAQQAPEAALLHDNLSLLARP